MRLFLPLRMDNIDDFGNDRGIRKGADISQLILLSRQNLSQNPPHNLSRSSLGKVLHDNNALWRSKWTNCLTNLEDEFFGELRGRFHVFFQRDECIDRYLLKEWLWRVHCPVNSSEVPTTAASATPWYITNAASISAVLNRWPLTLTTSSTRPRIQ